MHCFVINLYSIGDKGKRNLMTTLYSTREDKGYNIVPGTIKEEVNKAGSFEFDVYNGDSNRNNYFPVEGSDYIAVEDATIINDDFKRYLFYGRVINYTVDLQGKCHVTCEGLLTNLLDFPLFNPTSVDDTETDGMWIIRKKNTAELFRTALRAYSEISNRGDIRIGSIDSENDVYSTDTDTDGYFVFEYPWNQSVGDFISSELLNNYGGILQMRYHYTKNDGIYGLLSWVGDPLTRPSDYKRQSQSITYGVNVLEANIDAQGTDVVNGIVASRPNENGKAYFRYKNKDTNHYNPYIFWGVRDWDDSVVKAIDFDSVKTDQALEIMAERYVKIYCTGRKYNITAKVLDAYFLGQDDVERIYPLKKYHVNIPFPGREIDEDMFCLSSEIDFTNPANNSYTFGPFVPPETMNAKFMTRG